MKSQAMFALTVCLGLGLTGPSEASPTYLPIVQELGWPGQCDLCHSEVVGKTGTTTQPFAQTLKRVAMDENIAIGGNNTDNLNTVLDKLGKLDDSDGDMVTDLDELRQTSDPNDPGCSTEGCLQPYQGVQPSYGCALKSAPSGVERGWAWLAAALLSAGLVLSRRRG